MSSIAARTLVLLAVVSAAGAARAAPCGRPDVDLTFPPNDATKVPPNAALAAHYASPALYDDEPVKLSDATGADVPVAVSFDQAESTLRATPTVPLSSGFHELVWPGLRSVSSGGVGRGSTTSFFVQGDADTAPPSFAGLTAIDWDLARDRDPCLDRLDDRFVFRLTLGESQDDAATELLTVLVFETRDPARPDQAGPSQVAVRALPESGALEVRRPAEQAGKTCFAAVVRDLLGNVSGGGEREVCIETKQPPFFDGCSLARTTGARTSLPALAWALFVLGVGWCRRGFSAAAQRHPRA